MTAQVRMNKTARARAAIAWERVLSPCPCSRPTPSLSHIIVRRCAQTNMECAAQCVYVFNKYLCAAFDCYCLPFAGRTHWHAYATGLVGRSDRPASVNLAGTLGARPTETGATRCAASECVDWRPNGRAKIVAELAENGCVKISVCSVR